MLKRLRHPLAAAGLALAVAVAGIGLLVLPQRDRSGRLDREIASTRVQVASASAFVKEYHPEALDSADLFRLSKALPSSVGMPDLLLQLQHLALHFLQLLHLALRQHPTNFSVMPRQQCLHVK